MLNIFRSLIFGLIFFGYYLLNDPCDAGLMRVTGVDVEHPVVEYINKSLCGVYNVTARRLSRHDHKHYVGLVIETYSTFGNNITVDIRIDELLSNTYRPSFTARQMRLCDFAGIIIVNVLYARNISGPFTELDLGKITLTKCTFPPGVYDVQNVSWPVKSVPENFPFQKGRIFLKFHVGSSTLGNGYIDLNLKMLPTRRCRTDCH